MYRIRVVMFEYFLLSIKKMNNKAVFLQPTLDFSFETSKTDTTKLMADIADLLVGLVPLLPIVEHIRVLCPHRCH